MFGSPDAYGQGPSILPRHERRLRDRDRKNQESVRKARSEGKIVRGDSTFKRVDDPNSASGTRLERTGSVSQPKYESNKPIYTGPKPSFAVGSGGTNNTSVTPIKAEGASSPSYYEAVRKGPDGGRVSSSGNAGSGDGRNIQRGGATGTQLSLAQPTPADMGAFMNRLQSEFGIKFNFGEQSRNGYQSNALPGTAATRQFAQDEFSADDAQVMGMSPEDSATLASGGSIETVIGGSTAKGAQSGASDSADVGDQSRALRIPRGERQREAFFRQNPNYGVDTTEATPKGSGFSARSRAFLDYEGKGGAAMALRAAEAAQGTIRQNGVTYAMDAEGNATRISPEGEKALRADRDLVAGQEFLNNYKYVPAGPKETESPDVIRPVDTSVASDAYFSGNVGSTTNVGDAFDISESTKLESDPVNQPYNITEEIQMRSGKDVPMMRFGS